MKMTIRRALIVLATVTTACSAGNLTTPSPSEPGAPGGSAPGTTPTAATGPGISWRVVPQPFNVFWRSVAYGNGTFIAVGNGHKAYSTTGTGWQSYSYSSVTSYYGDNLRFAGGTFLSATGRYVQSTAGGTTWQVVTLPAAQALAGLTYDGSAWVGVDDRFLTTDRLAFFKSADNGATWSQSLTNIAYAQPTGVAYGAGVFVAVGYGGLLVTSPDGTNWTRRSFPVTDLGVVNIAFLNGRFLAVTNSGGIFKSSDGINWTHQRLGVNALWDVAYGNGVYVAVGAASTLWSSTDATTWTKRTWPGTHNNFEAVAFGNGSFVAIGDSYFAISP